MSQPAQTPDEAKRMHSELMRDTQYAKSRNNLLWASVICAVFLAIIGLMVMNDRLMMEGATVAITACVVVYFFFMVRMVKRRSAAEARWIHGQAEKREKKKERKKNR